MSDTKQKRAWYASPWFWGTLIFLSVLGVLAWIFWLQWQAHLANIALIERQDADIVRENALVLELQRENDELESIIVKFETLLEQEPCEIKVFLESGGLNLLLPQNIDLSQNSRVNSNSENTEQNREQVRTPAEAPPPPPISWHEYPYMQNNMASANIQGY